MNDLSDCVFFRCLHFPFLIPEDYRRYQLMLGVLIVLNVVMFVIILFLLQHNLTQFYPSLHYEVFLCLFAK